MRIIIGFLIFLISSLRVLSDTVSPEMSCMKKFATFANLSVRAGSLPVGARMAEIDNIISQGDFSELYLGECSHLLDGRTEIFARNEWQGEQLGSKLIVGISGLVELAGDGADSLKGRYFIYWDDRLLRCNLISNTKSELLLKRHGLDPLDSFSRFEFDGLRALLIRVKEDKIGRGKVGVGGEPLVPRSVGSGEFLEGVNRSEIKPDNRVSRWLPILGMLLVAFLSVRVFLSRRQKGL